MHPVLQNRAFQQVTPGKYSIVKPVPIDYNTGKKPGSSAALNAWQAVNGATISVIKETTPVSSALPNALHVTVPSGKSGQVGFLNTGYSGTRLKHDTS